MHEKKGPMWTALAGLLVSVISVFIGEKFFLFLLVGIALFMYGGVTFFVLRNKAVEKVSPEEHHARVSVHRTLYPLHARVKACPTCTALMYLRANYCTHCGERV